MERWKKHYPVGLERNYDYNTGVTLSGWLIDEEA
jgi:hypothetical protein